MATIRTEVEFEPEDYLDEVATEDLVGELDRRKDWPGGYTTTELCKQALDILHGGRVHAAIELLEKALYPKWSSEALCQQAYDQAMVTSKVTKEAA